MWNVKWKENLVFRKATSRIETRLLLTPVPSKREGLFSKLSSAIEQPPSILSDSKELLNLYLQMLTIHWKEVEGGRKCGHKKDTALSHTPWPVRQRGWAVV
jgi:hypothetical protein